MNDNPFYYLYEQWHTDIPPVFPAHFSRHYKRRNQMHPKWLKIASWLGVTGIVLIAVAYAPSVWYTLQGRVGSLSDLLFETAAQATETAPQVEAHPAYEPPYDANLALESRLVIRKIGVDTAIREAPLEQYEDALKQGVWRVGDFGTPQNRERSTILVAHRFGYLKWSNLYRKKNSFFNLPKLEGEDTIEITWRQRKYTYAVYMKEEGKEITDYSADLILYTCKDLTSDVRIFIYAKLLQI